MGKKRIIKSYEQLSEDLVERLKEKYPDGYEDRTITFTNPRGEIEVAIPFETEEIYYLIKLPRTNPAEEEEEVETSNFDEFDNFESLEIGDDVLTHADRYLLLQFRGIGVLAAFHFREIVFGFHGFTRDSACARHVWPSVQI